jgi:hypothetical protein
MHTISGCISRASGAVFNDSGTVRRLRILLIINFWFDLTYNGIFDKTSLIISK